MDDFIYLLVLIAWVIFAYYRRSQKKAEEARKVASRPRPGEPARPLPTLEEILMGEEPYAEDEPVPEPVATAPMFRREQTSPAETAFEREYNLRGITSLEELDKPIGLSIEVQPEPVVEGYSEGWQPVYASEIRNNIRQAVIYAEILNRPYV